MVRKPIYISGKELNNLARWVIAEQILSDKGGEKIELGTSYNDHLGVTQCGLIT